MSHAPFVLSYFNVNHMGTGGSRRNNALLRACGGEVTLCQPGEAHPEVKTLTYPRDWGKRKCGINWGIFNYLWPGTARRVRRWVAEKKPPVIILCSIWCYLPLRSVSHPPVVLDAHNVDAVAMGERFGNHHLFTRLVRAWEARVVWAVDHVFACSEQDRAQFLSLYQLPPERVSVVPNGVNSRPKSTAVIPADLEAELQDATVLFFMGKQDYQPNIEALSFMSERVMPALEDCPGGPYRLLVAGGPKPTAKLHPHILCTGMLPDDLLLAVMERADICLAPIFSGSGTRLKILEYMAAGKPVVATAKGSEGLVAESGQDYCQATAETFVETIAALAQSPDKREALGRAGQEVVRQHYDWDASITQLWRRELARWVDAYR